MWSPVPIETSTKQVHHLRLSEHWGSRSREIVRARGPGLCCEMVSPWYARSYTNKASPPWLPKHNLHEENNRQAKATAERPRRSTLPKEQKASSEFSEWEKLSSPGMITPTGYSIVNEKMYIRLYLGICMYLRKGRYSRNWKKSTIWIWNSKGRVSRRVWREVRVRKNDVIII